MSWYKKAKLVDSNPNAECPVFTTCQFCNRWKTDDSKVWKKPSEFNEQEEIQEEAIKKMIPNELPISHGICDYCNKIIEIQGWPKNTKDVQLIKSMSLAID